MMRRGAGPVRGGDLDEIKSQGGEPDALRAIRQNKLRALQASGDDPFRHERYDRTHLPAQVVDPAAPHWSLSDEERQSLTMRVAGRLTAAQTKGKVTFADIRDETGRVQLYVRRDDLGDEDFAAFNDLDGSDIVGVEGFPFHTRTGEPSIHVKSFTLLAKSLRAVPFGKVDEDGTVHGALTDREKRHRYRYLDLMANPESRDVLTRRCRVVSAMRRFLDGRGFLEVETPVLQQVAGGAIARPFTTHHNALDHDFKLRISLELYLKRLIVGGYDRVYEIGRVYRNEGMSTRHNPEFTLMELYQAFADLDDMMELVEAMYVSICTDVNGAPAIPYDGRTIDLSVRPWRRLPMLEGIRTYAGIAPEEFGSLEQAKAGCRRIGVSFDLDRENTLGRTDREAPRTVHAAATGRAHVHHRLSDGDFAAGKEAPGQSGADAALRGLCRDAGTGQRLLGNQRSDRPAGAIPGPACAARSR